MKISNGTIIMDETAWPLWLIYIESRSEVAALQELSHLHQRNKSKMNLVDVDGFGGGMFLTDIPDSEMALLEVCFGNKSSLGLYSRNEAREIAVLVMNALGIQSDDTIQ